MENKIFFTSDWHLGHSNILNFSNRPFKDMSYMHEGLIKRYNAVVPKDGLCYFLGDMGKLPSGEFIRIMNELKGTKILLLGNHDRNMSFYLRHGFSVVLQNASIHISNHVVTMSHYPLIGVKREDTSMYKGKEHQNWYKEDEFKEFALYDYGQFHLQAHLHSPNEGRSKVIEGRQWDIGVDGNNYTPVSIKQVSSWMDRFNYGQ